MQIATLLLPFPIENPEEIRPHTSELSFKQKKEFLLETPTAS
jgi:hypothetical protein